MRHLDDEALQHVARYFSALAVPVRLKILNALRDGELNVGELTELTRSTQANVSKHLALLMHNGLVTRETRGTSAYYRIADPATYDLCDIACGHIGKHFTDKALVVNPTASTRARASRSATRK